MDQEPEATQEGQSARAGLRRPLPGGPARRVGGDATARGWRRLLRPRIRRVDLLVAVLLGVLGFGAAVQVRSARVEGVLSSARQEDLVQILDELSSRSDRLRQEMLTLTAARDRLTSDSSDQAALAEAQRRTQVLGILAGTEPARGAGIVLTIEDPTGGVRADSLLDVVEELRDAGAEALQMEGAGGAVVRVVASTSFLDGDGGGVLADGVLLRAPYRLRVVGDSGTLASALGIPGGVVDTIAQLKGRAGVERSPDVVVAAVRPAVRPRYATPVPGG